MTAPRQSARLERSIGRVLLLGVLVSSVALAAGLGLWLVSGSAGPGERLINAGLIVLIATPAGRVVISIAEYLLERDWLFASLTTIVLAELIASVVAARR